MTTFTTITEATEYVETVIGDEYAADFDIEAIAREVTEWVDGKLTLMADDADFWAIVERHDTSMHVNIYRIDGYRDESEPEQFAIEDNGNELVGTIELPKGATVGRDAAGELHVYYEDENGVAPMAVVRNSRCFALTDVGHFSMRRYINVAFTEA